MISFTGKYLWKAMTLLVAYKATASQQFRRKPHHSQRWLLRKAETLVFRKRIEGSASIAARAGCLKSVSRNAPLLYSDFSDIFMDEAAFMMFALTSTVGLSGYRVK
jgi:hypothetical protein